MISADDAVRAMLDGDTVATGGFVGIGVPKGLAVALEQRYLASGSPSDLTLVYPAGQGDGKTRGSNHFAHEGMVRRIVGGVGNATSLSSAYCQAMAVAAFSGAMVGRAVERGVLERLLAAVAGGGGCHSVGPR